MANSSILHLRPWRAARPINTLGPPAGECLSRPAYLRPGHGQQFDPSPPTLRVHLRPPAARPISAPQQLPWRAALMKSLPWELSGVLLSLGWLVAVAVGDATFFLIILLYCFYI